MRNFEGRTSCKYCGGRGFISLNIDMAEFIDIVDEGGLSTGNKIQAIKDVRTKWDVGLKDAKNMVEAYQDFLNSIATIMERD